MTTSRLLPAFVMAGPRRGGAGRRQVPGRDSKGAIASLIGKDPPEIRYWLVNGDIPAFARFEGAMFLNGPVWRLGQSPLEWGK